MGFHRAEQIVSHNRIISRKMERNRIAFLKKNAGIIDHLGIVLRGDLVNIRTDIIDQQAPRIPQKRTRALRHSLTDPPQPPDPQRRTFRVISPDNLKMPRMAISIQSINALQRGHPLRDRKFGNRNHMHRGNRDDNTAISRARHIDLFKPHTPARNNAQIARRGVKLGRKHNRIRQNTHHTLGVFGTKFGLSVKFHLGVFAQPVNRLCPLLRCKLGTLQFICNENFLSHIPPCDSSRNCYLLLAFHLRLSAPSADPISGNNVSAVFFTRKV